MPLQEGAHAFTLAHRAPGQRRGEGTLALDGHVAGRVDMSPTTILGLGVGEGLDVGCDRKLHVTPLYGRDGPFPYRNAIDYVRIEPGPQAPDSHANRRERDAQRD
jgi:arylsulfatase